MRGAPPTTRFVPGFAVLLLSLGVLAGVAYVGLARQRTAVSALRDSRAAANQVDDLLAVAPRLQLFQSSLLAPSPDASDELQRHRETVDDLSSSLAKLRAATNHGGRRTTLQTIERDLSAYRDDFAALVAARTELTDSRTRARATLDSIEATLTSGSNVSLSVPLRAVWRAEETFYELGNQAALAKHAAAVARLRDRVSATAAIRSAVKSEQLAAIDRYGSEFLAAASAASAVENRARLLQQGAGRIESGLDTLRQDARARVGSAEREAMDAAGSKQFWVLGLAAMTGLFGIFLALRISRHLSVRADRFLEVADRITRGDISDDVELGPDDELRPLAQSFQTMLISLREHEAATRQREWMQAGLTRINETVRGEEEIFALASKVIAEVARFLHAPLAAIYLRQEQDDGPVFVMAAAYGCEVPSAEPISYRLGEGLIGKSAREQTPVIVDDIPAGYATLASAAGDTKPHILCINPIVHNGVVSAIIEVGLFSEPTDDESGYLQQAAPAIAIAVERSQARHSLGLALREAQRLSSDLQEQQQELRAANRELQERASAMHQSERDLKAQSEELQQINQKLEERNAQLREQKAELERAKGQLTRKAEDLALASKYKSDFLATMSHEFRTPLNSLLLLAKLLRDNKEGNLTAEQVESAGVIFGAGSDLLDLVTEILDLSKIEAGRLNLKVEKVSIRSIASSLEAVFAHLAQNQGLTFHVDISDDCPQQIVSDRGRIGQILKNLVSNALKFTEGGEVNIAFARPSTGLDLSRSGLGPSSAIAIAVSDTGIGIAANRHRAIFEAFRQADGRIIRRYGGSGLGLSISRELVKLLGGEIHVESTVGRGSTFTVYLPLETQLSPDKKPKLRPLVAERLPERRDDRLRRSTLPDDRYLASPIDRRILIIDDDAGFAREVVAQCRERKLKWVVATSGEDGIERVGLFAPDAIILSLELPVMTGLHVLEHLKEHTSLRHIPVFAVSSDDPQPIVRQRGAIDQLQKPLDADGFDRIFDAFDRILSTKTKRLLIVEDDDATRRSLVQLMTGNDIEIEGASGAKEAISALLSKQFECMILDLGLEDMDGEELLDAIAADESLELPPVVVYTGRDCAPDQESRLRRYADSIIIKGVRSEEQLLDEASLYLHRQVDNMSPEQRKIIMERHDSDEQLEGKTVLIVEDDVRSRYALSNILSKRSMNVLSAENGLAALELLEKHGNIELILMDVMMPVMDGYEAMKRIRAQERYSHLPIIALTAKALDQDREECLSAGANACLTKPFDHDRLLAMIRSRLLDAPGLPA